MKKAICIALLLAVALIGQTTYSTEVTTKPAFVPATATDVVARDVFVMRINLSNTSASAVTVTISDKSTNCNSGPCQIWPAVTIAANTVYMVDVGGEQFIGGIRWSATAANAVVGSIRYRY